VFDTVSGVGSFFWAWKDSGYVKYPYHVQSGNVSFNTSCQPTSWWTHNLTIGYSENSYHSSTDVSIYTDTALIKYYTGHNSTTGFQEWIAKDKTPTLSYNNVIKINSGHAQFKMNILSGIEYSNTKHKEVIYNNELHYTTSGGFTYNPNRVTGSPFYIYNREFTGAFLQLAPIFREKYFLVAGARYEKSNVSAAVIDPRVGFTTNFESAQFIIKPRINWGRSVTPPPYNITHPPPPFGPFTFIANPDIKPKEQGGADVAIEIYDKKDKFKVEIVRYDNIIKNDFGTVRTIVNNGAGLVISYINIGKYAYNGWEFSSEYKFNNFKVSGNYSIIKATYVDSFVGRKNFHNGDKLDNIPNYAAGASLNYSFPQLLGKSDRLSATVSLTSSGKMIAADYYTYIIDFAKWRQLGSSGPSPNYNNYYRETTGVTKYNLNVDWQFQPSLRFFIQVQNFTNNKKPDLDRSYPTGGAYWMFGLSLNLNKATK
jgi:outer membrane receptor protein involved in Fe transport